MDEAARRKAATVHLTRTGLTLMILGAVVLGSGATASVMFGWHQGQMAAAANDADFTVTLLNEEHADALQTCTEAVAQAMALAVVEATVIDNDHQAVDDFFDRYSYTSGDATALIRTIAASKSTLRTANQALEDIPCSVD